MREAAPTTGVPIPVRTVEVAGRTWTLRQEGAAEMGRGHGSARILSIRVVGDNGAPESGTSRYLAATSLGEATEEELTALVRESIGTDPE